MESQKVHQNHEFPNLDSTLGLQWDEGRVYTTYVGYASGRRVLQWDEGRVYTTYVGYASGGGGYSGTRVVDRERGWRGSSRKEDKIAKR